MRKKFTASIVAIMLACMLVFAACGDPKPNPNPNPGPGPDAITSGDVVSDLEITQMPSKLKYKNGERFNPAGLLFDVVYENGYDGDVDLTGSDLDGWEPAGALTADVTKVKLKFEGFVKEISITVENKVLNSIELAELPNIRSYAKGDRLNLAGLVVNADYAEGKIENESGYVIKDAEGNIYEDGMVLEEAADELELTVSLTVGEITKEASFTIHIYSGITLQAEDAFFASEENPEPPTDRSYTVMQNLGDKTWTSSNAIFKNDCTWTGSGYLSTTKNLVVDFYIYSEVDIDGADLVLVAASTLNGSDRMLDMQFNRLCDVYIVDDSMEPPVTEPTEPEPTEPDGTEGEAEGEPETPVFDPTPGKYNETKVWIDNDVILEGKPFPAAGSGGSKWTNWCDVPFGRMDIKEGFNHIRIYFLEGDRGVDGSLRTPNVDRLDVRVSDNPAERGDVVTDITIKSNPTKTAYKVGEKFDPTGLTFDVVYQNGYEGDKDFGVVKINWEEKELTTQDTFVEISYRNIKKQIPIVVTEKVLESIEILREPLKYNAVGDVLNLGGLVVEATYDSGKEIIAPQIVEKVEVDGVETENIINGYIVKDSEGNSVGADYKLTEIPANGLTFTVEYENNGVTKTAEFAVKTYENKFVVEAENTTVSENASYVVHKSINKVENNDTASGGKGVSTKVGTVIEFYIYSETEIENAEVIINLAANRRNETLFKQEDVQANKIVTVAVDDEEIVLADTVYLKGKYWKYTDENGQAVSLSSWYTCSDFTIGVMTLKEGFTKVTLTVTGRIQDMAGDKSMRTPNVDCLQVRY